ncbi:MAG: hypothetical protein GC134_05375 [Proteobacteria bacterium]|nr:hypothetical protein [Pseudomonadota bacterium]
MHALSTYITRKVFWLAYAGINVLAAFLIGAAVTTKMGNGWDAAIAYLAAIGVLMLPIIWFRKKVLADKLTHASELYVASSQCMLGGFYWSLYLMPEGSTVWYFWLGVIWLGLGLFRLMQMPKHIERARQWAETDARLAELRRKIDEELQGFDRGQRGAQMAQQPNKDKAQAPSVLDPILKDIRDADAAKDDPKDKTP